LPTPSMSAVADNDRKMRTINLLQFSRGLCG
jgi:hypothetical protein